MLLFLLTLPQALDPDPVHIEFKCHVDSILQLRCVLFGGRCVDGTLRLALGAFVLQDGVEVLAIRLPLLGA